MQIRGVPPSAKVIKHYFCGRDKDGKIIEETFYIQRLDVQPLIQYTEEGKVD